MLTKTRGIIFRTVKYSESSLICDIYTEELGLRSYIISGVRSKKPKVSASLLQLMSLVDLVVYDKEGKDLNRTKEVKPAYVYHSIPFEILRSSVGLFMVELARKTIKEAESNKPLFNFLFDSFLYLDSMNQGVANFHIYFTVQLTKYLGFMPGGDFKESTMFFDLEEGLFSDYRPRHQHFMDEKLTQLLHQFLHDDIKSLIELKLSQNYC